jgi:hypothetical protein
MSANSSSGSGFLPLPNSNVNPGRRKALINQSLDDRIAELANLKADDLFYRKLDTICETFRRQTIFIETKSAGGQIYKQKLVIKIKNDRYIFDTH